MLSRDMFMDTAGAGVSVGAAVASGSLDADSLAASLEAADEEAEPPQAARLRATVSASSRLITRFMKFPPLKHLRVQACEFCSYAIHTIITF